MSRFISGFFDFCMSMRTQCERNAIAMRTQCERNAKYKTILYGAMLYFMRRNAIKLN